MGLMSRRGAGVGAADALSISDTRKSAAICRNVRRGSITLVSGAATITDASFNADTVVSLGVVTPGGTMGAQYKQTYATGTITIQAISLAGANVTTDTSTLSYVADTPTFHADQTPQAPSASVDSPAASMLTVTASNATDLPSSITLANQLRQVVNQHMADAVAHAAADATNPVTTAVAVDLTTTEALLNAIKTALNAHFTQSGVHIHNDDVNTVSTSNATDLPSSETLANALKTAVNAHLASAPPGESVTVINP